MKEYILEVRKKIPQNICNKIIKYFDKNLNPAQVTDPKKPVNKNVRNCELTSLTTTETFGQKIVLNYVRKQMWDGINEYRNKYPFLGVEKINQIDLLKYESNNFDAGYKSHIDQGTKTNKRHLSISIALNNEYTGGEFFFELSNGEQIQIPQNVGDMIIFPSNFMFPHQVNTVTNGTRYALIGWAF